MSKSILVIEAESHIRRLIQVNLEWAGNEVFCAANAVEARLCMEIVQPLLVIVDTRLPDVEPGALLDELKAKAATYRLYFILLRSKQTANTEDWNRLLASSKRLGPTSYLTKPFNPMELLIFVKQRLREDKTDGFPVWRERF